MAYWVTQLARRAGEEAGEAGLLVWVAVIVALENH